MLRVEDTMEKQPEMVTGDAMQTEITTVDNSDFEITINDTDPQNDKNKEITDYTANVPESSPFGPWMMVRRNPRFKGRSIFSQSNGNNHSSMNGSRFATLTENPDLLEEDLMEQHKESIEERITTINNKDQAYMPPKKFVKGRSSTSNKYNTVKPKQANNGPSTSLSIVKPMKESKTPSELVEPQNQSMEEKKKR
ncbi:hypothetical protein RIF29_20072 [Crotalaria pallida]|uniref:Uncharacterized protein n=1 Tax=Crotalaria pallida TaxID=3830 RepID=A0AAN9I8B4_CROPI